MLPLFEADAVRHAATLEVAARMRLLRWVPWIGVLLAALALVVGFLGYRVHSIERPIDVVVSIPPQAPEEPAPRLIADYTMVESFKSGADCVVRTDRSRCDKNASSFTWMPTNGASAPQGGGAPNTCAMLGEIARQAGTRRLVAIVTGGHDLSPLDATTRAKFDSNYNLAFLRAQRVVAALQSKDCTSRPGSALAFLIAVSGSKERANASDRKVRVQVIRE